MVLLERYRPHRLIQRHDAISNLAFCLSCPPLSTPGHFLDTSALPLRVTDRAILTFQLESPTVDPTLASSPRRLQCWTLCWARCWKRSQSLQTQCSLPEIVTYIVLSRISQERRYRPAAGFDVSDSTPSALTYIDRESSWSQLLPTCASRSRVTSWPAFCVT